MATHPAPDDELRRFIADAKRSTYAAQSNVAHVAPVLLGSTQLEYRHESRTYRDIYFGASRFAGQEVVHVGDRAVWSMSYAGGILPDAIPEVPGVYAFLRRALLHVGDGMPVRGPATFADSDHLYSNRLDGSFERFSGFEVIRISGQVVYELSYQGGLLE